MARRVFFSFHYDDVKAFRANVVRNHGYFKGNQEAGFFDASIWEDAKLHGSDAVKKLINKSLENTSVTCVLIGSETWNRRWVRYEIMKSYDRGNDLIGVHVNTIADKDKKTFPKGKNPFYCLGFYISKDSVRGFQERDVKTSNWKTYQDLKSSSVSYDQKWRDKGYTLGSWVKVYDWVADKGYDNFGDWVENAK